MTVRMEDLPDTARIWVYGADRPFDAAERRTLESGLAAFLDRWTAHGTALRAAARLHEGRFVLVSADENAASASGCSIDALVRYLGEVESRFERSLLDGSRIFFRDAAGVIEACDRPTFRRLAEEGRISASTPVFDLTIGTLGELRAGRLERPLASSWHRRLVEKVLEGV